MHSILHIDMLDNILHKNYAEMLSSAMERNLLRLSDFPDKELEEYCEVQDADIVLFSVDNSTRIVQRALNASRSLRIPYIFITSTMQELRLPKRVLLPVTMLEEEVYKAQVAGTFVRRLGCEVSILVAHDYGSKARINADKINTALQQTNAQVVIEQAEKDSFHILNEVVDRLKNNADDLVFLTASRDYGLDDIIFGPPERKVIRQSIVPVMLVSPRDDLFSLCD